MNLSIQAFARLRTHFSLVDSSTEEELERVVSELSSHQWETSVEELPRFNVDRHEGALPADADPNVGLVLRARYEHPPSLPTDPNHWIYQHEKLIPERLLADFARTELRFALRQLLLCANLAVPGVLSVVSFISLVESSLREQDGMMLSDPVSAAVKHAPRVATGPIGSHCSFHMAVGTLHPDLHHRCGRNTCGARFGGIQPSLPRLSP
jgi:hypothetical protein